MRTLTPYMTNRRPFATDLFDEVERMFESFAAPANTNSERRFTPAFEVSETEDHYLLGVDLPGIKKEDLKIELNDNVLSISGERKRGNSAESFTKRFTLPKTVDVEKIEANYEDGVLNMYLPKAAAAKPRSIEIQSKSGGFFEKLIGSKKVGEDTSSANSAH
ncbi:hypothetical protein AZI87_05465 [Bdellovibrio bacteriovorus]|uniref:Uncharacterized protein n=1 Tax=Bdellovibrio bacteriovorus TaxID=959 RepID=A0A162GQ62_BDEBC|nr:Hsp20/alpha crystallin family protein [Bdellovibrio bacteriovorus]KYG68683.1 hypothetical protein AZI87_05465 [Bdellovibrio bacteriovorus]